MIKGENMVVPTSVETVKSKEVFKYYELVKWNDTPKEIRQEINFKLK